MATGVSDLLAHGYYVEALSHIAPPRDVVVATYNRQVIALLAMLDMSRQHASYEACHSKLHRLYQEAHANMRRALDGYSIVGIEIDRVPFRWMSDEAKVAFSRMYHRSLSQSRPEDVDMFNEVIALVDIDMYTKEELSAR